MRRFYRAGGGKDFFFGQPSGFHACFPDAFPCGMSCLFQGYLFMPGTGSTGFGSPFFYHGYYPGVFF